MVQTTEENKLCGEMKVWRRAPAADCGSEGLLHNESLTFSIMSLQHGVLVHPTHSPPPARPRPDGQSVRGEARRIHYKRQTKTKQQHEHQHEQPPSPLEPSELSKRRLRDKAALHAERRRREKDKEKEPGRRRPLTPLSPHVRSRDTSTSSPPSV